ncbi:MAG TPA: nitrite/sulfite reductase, partial [Candidatus Polarisedimenticolia bacterium]|nr:nitrite/sulfite reductase [Candidatus Polarisedimenticolia bacterium]
AQTLEEFVPAAELLPVVKAILEVASEHGNRRNKTRARLKFVVHKLGIEAFRERVTEASARFTREERAEADLRRFVPEHLAPTLAWHLSGRPPLVSVGEVRRGAPGERTADPAYHQWKTRSVRAHRDPSRCVVTVMVPLGDLEAGTLRGLAALVRDLADDQARVAINQNLVLPSVKRSNLRALYNGLKDCGFAEAGVGTALDVTCCPGADTCNLGIASSKGLTRAIRERLSHDAAELTGLTIKISGCPNSCGQHHIANIGLHGVVKKIDGRQVPAYQLHLGGRVGPGTARIGHAVHKLAAKKVPDALAALLEVYRVERSGDEPFAEFIQTVPSGRLEQILAPFGEEPSEAPAAEELFVDWGQTTPYTTDDMGTGECAGAGIDAAVEPFDNYEAEVLQASLFMRRGQWVDALANLNRSQYTLARVLLKEVGKTPDSDHECVCELRAQVIDRGHAGELWNEHHEEIEKLLRTRQPEPAAVEATYRRSHALLEEARTTLRALARSRAAGGPAEIPG